MLKIIEKRWALLEVVIVDTLVQGDEASYQIAKSLRYADTLGVDVVVVGRGGGSAEDLWAFNEERVADAIFHMRTPVVSAVGHEVDVLMSDFVADLRAPTPSAAMEMILSDGRELLYMLDELNERYHYAVEQKLQQRIEKLKHIEDLLLRSSPTRKLQEISTQFMRLENEFKRVMVHKMQEYESMLPALMKHYHQTVSFVLEKKMQHLIFMEQKLVTNNPKLQCRDGWAKTSFEGKIVSLSELQINHKFVLEDAFTKIEALCLNKI